jgi:hypothetical protein
LLRRSFDMATQEKAAPEKVAPAATGTTVPVVKWDDSTMATTYANVCNVTGTREEVALLFGTNQTLYTGQQEVTVKLSNRIVLSPFAAKRLQKLLENVIGQYEQRFGKLDIEMRA